MAVAGIELVYGHAQFVYNCTMHTVKTLVEIIQNYWWIP